MAFRPNYRQARGERDRAKQLKKDEKLRKREEDAARRKGEIEPGEIADGLPGNEDDEPALPTNHRDDHSAEEPPP